MCYVGHGIWKNNSTHTFNNAQKRVLDLESALRTCAQMQNVYVLAVFDCCRQEFQDGAGKSRLVAERQGLLAPGRLVTFYRDAHPS